MLCTQYFYGLYRQRAYNELKLFRYRYQQKYQEKKKALKKVCGVVLI